MDAAQKRVIFGEALLLPVDAIVESGVDSTHWVVSIGSRETHWKLQARVFLTVSHVNFPKGQRSFGEQHQLWVPTGQVRGASHKGKCILSPLTSADRYSPDKEIYFSPHVKTALQSIQAVVPKLQNFIVDEYATGEVSLERIVDFFNQHYRAPSVATSRKSRKKAA